MKRGYHFSLPDSFRQQLNRLGQARVPFVFIVDYEARSPRLWKVDDISTDELLYDLNGFRNVSYPVDDQIEGELRFSKSPVSFDDYSRRFNTVRNHILAGNSFLVNFSQPTIISTNRSLLQIFMAAAAPYKVWLKDELVCFSPEIFVRIEGHNIASFPMKGTIDKALPRAASRLLSDEKEAAEHATIVDLIRNDLSRVAKKVWVERYRYLDEVITHDKVLLQMSSEVRGVLPDNFDNQFGDLLESLLPAGSITGAPKPYTLQIIKESEEYDRGYYTGIMGYFDGRKLETSVMIRFIEQTPSGLLFKSGGGITSRSRVEAEYQELLDKVYLPFRPHDGLSDF